MKARNNDPPDSEELFSRNVEKQIMIAKYFMENIKIKKKLESWQQKGKQNIYPQLYGPCDGRSLHVCVVYLLSSVYTMNLEIHHHQGANSYLFAGLIWQIMTHLPDNQDLCKGRDSHAWKCSIFDPELWPNKITAHHVYFEVQ